MSIELKDLIAAGVHFGHQTSRWSPKMKPYIWGQKNKVHLIDVSKTAHQLEKAGEFLKSVAEQGKQILFVGTKKSAQDAVQHVTNDSGSPYVTHRWIGGTLTNFPQVKKSITKLLHFEDVLAKSEKFSYTKKERNRLQKAVNRLKANIGGIVNLRYPIGALVVVDVRKEQAAVKEAAVIGVPIVAIVDTNSDPSLINYVIPGNDDSAKAIRLLLDYLGQEIKKGKEAASQKASEAAAAREAAGAESAAIEVTEVGALPDIESEEENVAREQARARKLRETIKAKKGDTRRPAGRARRPAR
jgi:small subunit ribosomal protein S2